MITIIIKLFNYLMSLLMQKIYTFRIFPKIFQILLHQNLYLEMSKLTSYDLPYLECSQKQVADAIICAFKITDKFLDGHRPQDDPEYRFCKRNWPSWPTCLQDPTCRALPGRRGRKEGRRDKTKSSNPNTEGGEKSKKNILKIENPDVFPDASKRIRTHPSRSEWVQTRPRSYENFEKLAKTS